jgi:hypothetical protein
LTINLTPKHQNDNNIGEAENNKDVKRKLIRKGLTLTGMSDKDMIFVKLKHYFL